MGVVDVVTEVQGLNYLTCFAPMGADNDTIDRGFRQAFFEAHHWIWAWGDYTWRSSEFGINWERDF